MTNLTPTNFTLLEQTFSDIIIQKRDTDQTGEPTNVLISRKTYVFKDRSFLSITEIIKNNKIDLFHYDWFDNKKQIIAKFHSEPHKRKEDQTATEPFHAHVPDTINFGKYKRLPNHSFMALNDVFELIRFCNEYLKHV